MKNMYANIPNLGEIVTELKNRLHAISYGYEMDCLISSEFTPSPNFDNAFSEVAQKFAIPEQELATEILRRVDHSWLAKTGISFLIPEQCFQ